MAQFFNITPNHLSKLFAQHGTMRFIEYVRWVRMAKARMILQKYHLESVAQFFNITPNHLSKLFAQHGTMRFIEYVRWVRMAKARMILQKYHLSIHEVAQRCGFPDSDYFCRVFRRQFGLTPGEYSARFQG